MTLELEDQIRTRAYFIWEGQGCPQGCDVDHWLIAESEVSAQEALEAQPAALKKAAAPRKTTSKTTAKAAASKAAAPKAAAAKTTAKAPKAKLVAATASAQKPAAAKLPRRTGTRATQVTLN